jgi:hypothetical protein
MNGEFSLADVAMIPFIDRITKLRPEILGCGKYPKVMSWYDQMKSRPAFDLKMTPALRNCRTSDAGEMAKRRGHFCAGFRTPVLLSESRADAGGVRKAQRHEILTAPVSFNLWRNACKRSISRRNSRSTKAASRASSSQHSLVPNSVA